VSLLQLSALRSVMMHAGTSKKVFEEVNKRLTQAARVTPGYFGYRPSTIGGDLAGFVIQVEGTPAMFERPGVSGEQVVDSFEPLFGVVARTAGILTKEAWLSSGVSVGYTRSVDLQAEMVKCRRSMHRAASRWRVSRPVLHGQEDIRDPDIYGRVGRAVRSLVMHPEALSGATPLRTHLSRNSRTHAR